MIQSLQMIQALQDMIGDRETVAPGDHFGYASFGIGFYSTAMIFEARS